MRVDDSHVLDQDLLRAADGELTAREAAAVRRHLSACWRCRARLSELESAIAGFIEVHRNSFEAQIPPPEGARALLKARMRALAAESPAPGPNRTLAAAACVALAVAMVALALMVPFPLREPVTPGIRFVPDPRLTPGATLPVSLADICDGGAAETVRLVPAPVARRVFASYGIAKPRPRAFELDYLITPALGGADHIRNFWPQPYDAVWNAHLKDALEDHLHRLVCAGSLDLETAQRDLARDWIAAYRKYFGTQDPLPAHLAFRKDRPWE